MNRTIFIWDIHGCYDEFQLLLEKLKITDEDAIYIVWDMILKWPKSWKVMKFLYKNKSQFKCVIWNHELNFYRFLKNQKQYYNICNETIQSFEKLQEKCKKKPEVLEYFLWLPSFIEKENFIVLHGWIVPWKRLLEMDLDEITRTREHNNKPWFDYYTWDKKVFYGHWAQNWLTITNNTVWLDWGCVYGKSLHAYILENNEIVTQQALKLYIDVFDKD